MAKKDILQGRSIVRKNIFDRVNQSIDELKRAHPLVDYFESKGVVLTKSGDEYRGLCPFHDDTNPSLSVNSVKGVFRCFSCNKKGTVIDACAYFENVGTGEAIRILSSRKAALKLELPKEITPDRNAGAVDTGEEPVPVSLDDLVSHWQGKLYENTAALDYLAGRGFTSQELFTRFTMGYADGSLPAKLSEGQKKYLIDRGILNEQGNEKFYTCLIFPIVDEKGTTVSLYGRNITANGKVKHLYLKGGHKGIFNRKASRVYPEQIMLTESIIDALSLIHLGFENVQSLYGVNGFTAEHLQILKDDRVKEIVLAFDNDEAGRKGAETLKEQLLQEGFAVRIISPTVGKDWNDCLLQGVTQEAVQALIDEAEVFTPVEKELFEVREEHGKYLFTLNHASYSITGVKEGFVSSLKVNIKASREGESHYDTVNLYSSRSRSGYSLNLSRIFELEPRRVEKDLVKMLEYLEDERDKKLTGEPCEKVEVSPEEREIGLAFLQSSDLFDRIVDDFNTLGYVGEDMNKQLLYVCATSRLMDNPISVLISSQSASGKSYLIDKTAELMPPEAVVDGKTISRRALQYVGRSLMNTFCIMGEAVHDPDVEYQLRELLSSHRLTRMVTVKDERTGEMTTKHVVTEAVIASAMSTTRNDINPENASRYFIINADESEEQTRRIHEQQKARYSHRRYYNKKRCIPEIHRKHHSAQRLLVPREIVLSDDLGEAIIFPAGDMRTRRDNQRFIDLIAAVCFLRQYQKEEQQFTDGKGYIEIDIADYTIAYGIIKAILPATLFELPLPALDLYKHFREYAVKQGEAGELAAQEVTVTQRELREASPFTHAFIKRYLKVLVEYEYIRITGGTGKGKRYAYGLVKDAPIEQFDLTSILTPDQLFERQTAKGNR